MTSRLLVTQLICTPLIVRNLFFRWFKAAINPFSGKEDWLFNDGYWQRNWKSCPDIF